MDSRECSCFYDWERIWTLMESDDDCPIHGQKRTEGADSSSTDLSYVRSLAAENAKLREALERIAIYTGSRAAKIATEALEKK